MFIKKEKYNKLQKELEKEKKKTIMLQERIDTLEEVLSRLKDKEKEKASNNIEKLLRKQGYKYAILVKNYTTDLYNDGRMESGVRELSFTVRPGSIPCLEIIK